MDRTINNETSRETRYFISSAKDTATYFYTAVHNWGIENSLHGVLDVSSMRKEPEKEKIIQ